MKNTNPLILHRTGSEWTMVKMKRQFAKKKAVPKRTALTLYCLPNKILNFSFLC